MTISGIGSQGSILQTVRAQSAFQRVIKNDQEKQQQEIKLPVEPILKKEQPYINEIRSFAAQNNITDVEEDDIQYALKFGTSLFVDKTA